MQTKSVSAEKSNLIFFRVSGGQKRRFGCPRFRQSKGYTCYTPTKPAFEDWNFQNIDMAWWSTHPGNVWNIAEPEEKLETTRLYSLTKIHISLHLKKHQAIEREHHLSNLQTFGFHVSVWVPCTVLSTIQVDWKIFMLCLGPLGGQDFVPIFWVFLVASTWRYIQGHGLKTTWWFDSSWSWWFKCGHYS